MLSGVQGYYQKPLGWGDPRVGGLAGRNVFFQLVSSSPITTGFTAIFLSRVAQELALLLAPNDEAAVAKSIFESMDKTEVDFACIWPYNADRTIKPNPEILFGDISTLGTLPTKVPNEAH